jgi:formamidopyrimidine-DNA glycosylase
MPELPEVTNLARQMNHELTGRRISTIDVAQPKCLNMPVQEFCHLVEGTSVGSVTARGKWAFLRLEPGITFLLNLGMGGDALFHAAGAPLSENRQVTVLFEDAAALSLHFWWFGYVHAVRTADLASHAMPRVRNAGSEDPDRQYNIVYLPALSDVERARHGA